MAVKISYGVTADAERFDGHEFSKGYVDVTQAPTQSSYSDFTKDMIQFKFSHYDVEDDKEVKVADDYILALSLSDLKQLTRIFSDADTSQILNKGANT